MSKNDIRVQSPFLTKLKIENMINKFCNEYCLSCKIQHDDKSRFDDRFVKFNVIIINENARINLYPKYYNYYFLFCIDTCEIQGYTISRLQRVLNDVLNQFEIKGECKL